MIADFIPAPRAGSLHQLQQTFVTDILPRVQAHGLIQFQHIRCIHYREELLAEMVALCWKWFLRLMHRNKDVLQFVSALATYAARAVRSGRRVCGHERKKDVLSPVAQRQHHFAVGTLPNHSTLNGNPLDEALQDNTVSPVPEQVAFKIDFPVWRCTYTERDRRFIDNLMIGEGTQNVSRKFAVSPARVSQKRREYHEDWLAFCGETEQ